MYCRYDGSITNDTLLYPWNNHSLSCSLSQHHNMVFLHWERIKIYVNENYVLSHNNNNTRFYKFILLNWYNKNRVISVLIIKINFNFILYGARGMSALMRDQSKIQEKL